MARLLPILMASAVMLASLGAAAQDKKTQEPPVLLADPKLSVSLEAPNAQGPWILRVKNDDEAVMRIHADARLLHLLVAPKGKKYVDCQLPASMRSGDMRDLILKPGESYHEEIDPRLLCFGKVADEMGEGTSVTAFWGYKPDAARHKAKKPQLPPFVVEPSEGPAAFASQKRLVGLTTWLGATPDPKADPSTDKTDKPAEPTPINTGVLKVDPLRFVDASALRDVRMSAVVKNVGDRAALVHLRPDQLDFKLKLPDGSQTTCTQPRARRRGPVRDFFHTLAPKASEPLSVLLAEACPRSIFSRPGIYEVTTILHAPSSGSQFELHAITGNFEAIHRTIIRLQQAKLPYHKTGPKVDSAK